MPATSPQETTKPAAEHTILTEPEKAEPEAAPEKYEPFSVPEGYELDETASKEASTLFKEMNLSQKSAQKLVDFYVNKTKEAAEGPVKYYQETQEKWVKELESDKEIGPKLRTEVKQSVAKLIDSLGPELGGAFREAMDFTGAGNNPAFVKAMYAFAKQLTEGVHVRGNGPAPVKAPGEAPRSAGHALYPNLP